MTLKEIRIHGRGGQGAVTSSQLIAISAFFDGKQSQAFPMFGVERTGAPIQAFARISDEKIDVRQQVYEPDYVIVLDSTLLSSVDVAQGLKKDGLIIVNSDKKPEEFNLKGDLKVIDMTKGALEIIGKPFVNVCALGAFSALTKGISLESLNKAIDQEMKDKKIAELNKLAARKIFEESK